MDGAAWALGKASTRARWSPTCGPVRERIVSTPKILWDVMQGHSPLHTIILEGLYPKRHKAI